MSVAGFDDVPVAAITSPSLSTVRLPLREMGRRGFAEAARVLGGDELAGRAADRARDARVHGAAPPAARSHERVALRPGGRLVTGSSRGIGAEVAVKAAAEGATVAVHYHEAPTAPRGPSSASRAPAATATASARTSPTAQPAEGLVEQVIDRFGGSTASSTTPGSPRSGRSSRSDPASGTR